MNSETQLLLTRTRLMDELVEDGLIVAVPTNECGFDMLAFLETAQVDQRIVAVPIQVREVTDFSVHGQEMPESTSLLISYLWQVHAAKHSHLLALTRTELRSVIEKMQQQISRRDAMCDELLAPFMMTRGRWHEKISGMLQGSAGALGFA